MKIYKLKYSDKETAIANLLDKGVYTEDLSFGEGIHAIVELGKIVINQPTEEIKPIFADGYHYDVMSEQEIDFKENEIVVNNPKHGFLGYDTKN
jgi:hypothetical protein